MGLPISDTFIGTCYCLSAKFLLLCYTMFTFYISFIYFKVFKKSCVKHVNFYCVINPCNQFWHFNSFQIDLFAQDLSFVLGIENGLVLGFSKHKPRCFILLQDGANSVDRHMRLVKWQLGLYIIHLLKVSELVKLCYWVYHSLEDFFGQ